MNTLKIADNYSVSPQILPEDVPVIVADGFGAIICNRPDEEEAGQPSAADIAAACKQAGIEFHHIPITGMPVADEAIQEQQRIINSSARPTFAYCRSGQRCAVVYQMGLS